MSEPGDTSDYEDARQHHDHDDEEYEDAHPQSQQQQPAAQLNPVVEVPQDAQEQDQVVIIEPQVDAQVLQENDNVEIDEAPEAEAQPHPPALPVPVPVPEEAIHGEVSPQNNNNNHQQLQAGARLIVQQLIDNLWPVVGAGGDEDEIEDGLANVEDGYFEEDGNYDSSDDNDGYVDNDGYNVSEYSESEAGDESIVEVTPARNESDENNLVVPENEAESPPPPVEFDPQLPVRHEYLGEGMEELQGRVFLDEGSTPEIPLIVMGIQLVPGQTLPLTIFHAVFQNAIRRCIHNNGIFGIVYNDMDTPSGSMVYRGAFGTLAEIYEFQEEFDNPVDNAIVSNFSIKAKGRQMFNVLSIRRQADGNLMGTVKIRPEIRLPQPIEPIYHPQTHRYRFPLKRCLDEDEDETTPEASTNNLTRRLSISESSHSSNASDENDKEDDVIHLDTAETLTEEDNQSLRQMKKEIKERRKITRYYSAFTPFPYFVYEQFEEAVLVEKVHRKLKVEMKGVAESGSIIPKDATELSFWLAQNLTMDDQYRIKILKMTNPIQRLRFELDLLDRVCKVITCRNCQATVADSSDIFSMSIEGPQGTYVNPHGFVHETLTVYKTKELHHRGHSSTEASWFPGYAWTIVECRSCFTHLGWKFKAVGNRLKPQKFWGLARKSISFKYNFGVDADQDEPSNPLPYLGDPGQNPAVPNNGLPVSDFSFAII